MRGMRQLSSQTFRKTFRKRIYFQQRVLKTFCSESIDDITQVNSSPNQRFWTRSFSLRISSILNSSSTVVPEFLSPKDLLPIVTCFYQNLLAGKASSEDSKSHSNLPTCQSGLVILTVVVTERLTNSSFPFNLIVPIHNSILQPQHAFPSRNGMYMKTSVFPSNSICDSPLYIETNSSVKTLNESGDDISFLFCGFYPRAQHMINAPNEEERPVNMERLAALNAALLTSTSTNAEELLSEKMAGTPPARIYRSFVTPRANKKFILEPVERAALRTAAQIELAFRQSKPSAYSSNCDTNNYNV